MEKGKEGEHLASHAKGMPLSSHTCCRWDCARNHLDIAVAVMTGLRMNVHYRQTPPASRNLAELASRLLALLDLWQKLFEVGRFTCKGGNVEWFAFPMVASVLPGNISLELVLSPYNLVWPPSSPRSFSIPVLLRCVLQRVQQE